MNPLNHIKFPLDSFLQRLELAGFYIGPGQRLRLLRLLESGGKRILAEPEKLKFLICPVVAQGKADQERFYELFDQYWVEISKPWEMPKEEKKETQKPNYANWLPWAIVGLMLMCLVWFFSKLLEPATLPPLNVFFEQKSEVPRVVRIGDSLHLENLSEHFDHDTTGYFKWEIFDDKTEDCELTDSQSHHLHLLIDSIGASPKKKVHLTHISMSSGLSESMVDSFSIHCKSAPTIDSFFVKQNPEKGEEVIFQTFVIDSSEVTYEWDMGEKEDANFELGKSWKRHSFKESRQYQVTVRTKRKGSKAICESEKRISINVQEKQDSLVAFLAAKPLYYDEINPIVNFSDSNDILFILLGLAMIWFWVRWARRKAPQRTEDEKEMDLQSAAERFAAPDKGPYFIPFRSQEGHVRVERDLYRLADVLRQRQEGLRREMDVPTSVKETIAGGGFPRLLTQSDQVPTEYLFLLDERSWNSHQGRLFEFMVNFLRKREVLGEVFYFNQRLHSFWNKNYPEGLSPEKLYRLHSRHRVVLLSDGHALIEPSASGKQNSLRAEAQKLFFQWKNRLLITPLPLVSWTWREGVLHELFPIFPSHTGGLSAAAKFLEQGMDDDEMRPTYASWCERLKAPETTDETASTAHEPDVNYRRWRTAADHADYLKDYPELFRWLKALAVYPKPDWNITLAIGRALSPVGVKVTYDNLLILSRIPWLVTGELSPRLRKDLLKDLDPETEKLARQVVKEEMQAIEALVKGSHANREHQVELGLQNFALAPQDAENQELVRQLLALDLLSPKRVANLNQQVSPGTKERSSAPLATFLEKNRTDAAPLEKPFFTPDFYKACIATLIALIWAGLIWKYDGTKELAQFLGQDITSTGYCEGESLYGNFFIKRCGIDGAVILNNEAVKIWRDNFSENAIPNQSRSWEQEVTSKLEEATFLNSEYPLATSNLAKHKYNDGLRWYHAYLTDTVHLNGLGVGREKFREAIKDSMASHALHGLGLTHFYEEEFDKSKHDSSFFFYGEILSNSDTYFDSLETYPHLQSLLSSFILPSKITVFVNVIDAKTKKPLSGVVLRSKDILGPTDSKGGFSFKSELGERHAFEFTKKDYDLKREEVRATSDGVKVTVTMQPVAPPDTNPEVDPEIFDLPVSVVPRFKSLDNFESFALFFDENKPEPNPTQTTTNLTYGETFQNYSKRKNVVLNEATKRFSGSIRKKAIARYEVFFDEEIEAGYNALVKLSDLILDELRKDENVRVVLGNASASGTNSINQQSLDARRLSSIQNHFERHAGGVLSPYLESGDLELVSLKDEREEASAPSIQKQLGEREEWITRALGRKVEIVDVVVSSKMYATINVVDTGGKPVSGADVQIDPGNIQNQSIERYSGYKRIGNYPNKRIVLKPIELVTDANGQVKFEVQPESTFTISASKNGYVSAPRSPTAEELTQEEGLTIVLGTGSQDAPLKVIIEDEKGERVSGVSVKIREVNGKWMASRGTDESGQVEVEVNIDSEYEVTISKEGYASISRTFKPIDLLPDLELKVEFKRSELTHPAILFIEQDMVEVKGGTFMMGCDDTVEGPCNDDNPLHDVTLSSYSISKYEVTQELWEAVMGENPSKNQDCPKCPVEMVTWNEIQDFLKILNEKMPNRNFRLPTEAEWEYTARGGHNGKQRYRYAGSSEADEVAWYRDNSGDKTHPVGQKQANGLGLYDMSGNVWEWCSDWYGEDYYNQYQKGGARNPQGPKKGGRRVLRGGSSLSYAEYCRPTIRGNSMSGDRDHNIGFRLCMSSQ